MKTIEAYKVVLRDIRTEDLEQLRQWRNSPEIRLNMINQDIITEQQQQQWFNRLYYTNQEHYLVEYKTQAIGYANFKPDDNKNTGQTGLYIGELKYRGTILAFCLALALLDHVFIELNIYTLHADVLSHNYAAIRFNEQLGYVQQDSNNDVIKMTLSLEDYIEAKNKLTKLIRV